MLKTVKRVKTVRKVRIAKGVFYTVMLLKTDILL